MSKATEHTPSDEKSFASVPRLRLRGIFLALVLGLLVILPVVIEQKSLSSIALYSDQDEIVVSSVNATHNATKSPLVLSKQRPDGLQVHLDQPVNVSKIPGASAPESSPTQDPFLHQIDQYFDYLPQPQNRSETQWIRDYLYWHREMRKAFPEETLLDNPEGPNVTIVYLDPGTQKGGLTDRMKSLGHVLQRAYREQRVILFKWYDGPLPLESFLVPNILNFTVPSHTTTATAEQLQASYEQEGGKVKLVKFVNQFGNYLHPYGVIWHAIFQPSAPVKEAIDDTMTTLGLVAGKFDAVHCRIGHPAYRNKEKYDNPKDRVVDQEGGFKFEGTNRVRTMSTAIHGIQCAEWVARQQTVFNDSTIDSNTKRSIYFYADSPDLIRTVVTPSSLKARGEEQLSLVEELKKLGSEIKIVGRTNAFIAHLENRKSDTPSDAFMSTFVDLYIAAQARCIAMGVGRFAYMAAKLSGTSCWTRHQIPKSSVGDRWGMTLMSREVPPCRIPKNPS